MKKWYVIIFIILAVTTLSGCLSWPEADTIQIESDTLIVIDSIPSPDLDELEFFRTIEEAVASENIENEYAKRINKIIKLFENDEYAVLFYVSGSPGGNDWINVVRFAVKMVDKKRFYSTPYISTGLSWESEKWFVKKSRLDEIGEIRSSIASDALRYFRIDDSKNFFWGVSQTERVRNLRIEGQLVTEVIEVELDGEIAFFWYFDDLKTDKKPFFKDLREYNDGEFIITMD